MSETFGWDLVYKVSESDIKKKEDVLLVLVHFCLIKDGYRCIGLGDDKSLTGNETSSEILPTGWSESNSYSLRYVLNDQLFILRGVTSDDSIVLNLLNVASLAVSSLAFSLSETVVKLRGSISELVPGHDGVLSRIKKELLEPMTVRNNREESTQTSQPPPQKQQPPRPEFIPPRQPSASVDPFWNDPIRDPLRVGQSDLDPLGRDGGGMIFNPFGGSRIPDPGFGAPGGIPRGSIPPGARFDPFGPPMPPFPPIRRPPPDSDHFGPPGFGGMFM